MTCLYIAVLTLTSCLDAPPPETAVCHPVGDGVNYCTVETYDTGWSSRYDPYVMDWQVEYHDLMPPCDGCAIAVVDCSEIGNIWHIRPSGTDEWVPVIVADCARRDNSDGTVTWMESNNILLELSWDLAVRLDAVGNSVRIEVLK